MKKLLIAGMFALTLVTTAFAAPASSKAVSHFKSTFTHAKNISWTVNDRFEKVSFTENNQQIDVFYDANGEVIGTSKTMAFNKLPKNALEVLSTKYTFPEFQLKECIEFTNANNEKNYYLAYEAKTEKVVIEVSEFGAVTLMSKNIK